MPEKRYQAPAAASTLEVLEFMASNPGAWGPSGAGQAAGALPESRVPGAERPAGEGLCEAQSGRAVRADRPGFIRSA